MIATEGHISIKSNGKICVGACNTRVELLKDFMDNYKGYYRQRKRDGMKTVSEYEVSGKEAYRLLCDIQPYLQIKKTRAKLAITLFQLKELFGKVPEEMVTMFYAKCHELNRRGV